MHTSPIHSKQVPEGSNAVFSIVIPTWNNLEYLQLCVKSIRKNSSLKHQIILHINEGKDGTLPWAISQPDISFTYSSNNIGICYAVNSAAALANTNYIVFLNDDMYLCPEWDLHLVREIQKIGHDHFFLSGTAIEPNSNNNCFISANFGSTPKDFDEYGLLSNYNKLKGSDWLGATWPPNIVHRKLWEAVGGYSTEFSPGMYSDPDFSMKLWQAGVRYFKGVSESRAYHFGSVSTKKIKRNKGHYQFLSKWGISASTFTKYYLKRGLPFDGQLVEPRLSLSVKLKNAWKRLALVTAPVSAQL